MRPATPSCGCLGRCPALWICNSNAQSGTPAHRHRVAARGAGGDRSQGCRTCSTPSRRPMPGRAVGPDFPRYAHRRCGGAACPMSCGISRRNWRAYDRESRRPGAAVAGRARSSLTQDRYSIEHDGGQRRISVTFNVGNGSLQHVVQQAQQDIARSVVLAAGRVHRIYRRRRGRGANAHRADSVFRRWRSPRSC